MIEYILYTLLALILIFVLTSFRVIRPTERGLVERFGKYNRYQEAGLLWLIPFGIERLVKVDITENMVEAEPQEIITKDKLNASVDAQVYFKVKDDEKSVKNSEYNVANYYVQIVQLSRTTLRNIIGTLSLNEANSQRNKINGALMKTLSEETSNWGIEVVRTELKEINPPVDVQATMNEVVKAENQKQAAVDFATAAETQADGKRRAAIKEAEGERQAVILRAQGQAEGIKLVNESARKYFVGNAQKLKSLEVTQASLESNSKVVITEKGISPNIILGTDRVVPIRKK